MYFGSTSLILPSLDGCMVDLDKVCSRFGRESNLSRTGKYKVPTPIYAEVKTGSGNDTTLTSMLGLRRSQCLASGRTKEQELLTLYSESYNVYASSIFLECDSRTFQEVTKNKGTK